MAIVQAVLAAIFRSAGKLLNTAFGWATVMLFGKVPQDRQIYLSVIAFGAVIWIVALVGILVPSFATFLLSFVTLPAWVDRTWVRIAMLVLAVVIPPIIGWLSTRMVEAAKRPQGGPATVAAILKGYPYTFGLALTLIMMTVFAPIRKARNMARRWTAEHIPVIVKSEDYVGVVHEVQEALAAGGLMTVQHEASWMLRVPTRVLAVFARSGFGSLVADRLTQLESEHIEVLIHPSDLIIAGRPLDTAHARAILAERLTVTKAYLTWDKEGNDLEDRIRNVWRLIEQGRDRGAAEELRAIDEALHRIELPYEEWEILFRSKLLAERSLVRRRVGAPGRPVVRVISTLVALSPLLEEAADVARNAADEVRKFRRENARPERTVARAVASLVTPLRERRRGVWARISRLRKAS